MKHDLSRTVISNKNGGSSSPMLATQPGKISPFLAMASLVALFLAIAPSVATAAVIGFLGNFDVINDTGQTANGA